MHFPKFGLTRAQQRSGITFPVDDVAPANRRIWTQPLGERLDRLLKVRVLATPNGNRPVINQRADDALQRESLPKSVRQALLEYVSSTHPLIDAVHQAFSDHRPLVLSPDCIWLVIAQGFSHHIDENAEALRERLVRHKGKQTLTSKMTDLTPGGFARAIAGISDQIRAASDPVLHETLISNFSTTTAEIRTASEVVLMDTYSYYFDYQLHCVCGIPQVSLTGSVEDWQRIRARVEVLATYGLEWWVTRLRPVLDEFVQTAEGRPNPVFWQAIYKPKHAYGKDTVTGWIADLFPYLGDAPNRRRNNVLQHRREDWAIPVEAGLKTFLMSEVGAAKGASGFPSGLARVPIRVTFPDTSNTKVDLYGGFLGVEQDERDLALSPVISWCVAEQAAH